MKLNELFLGKVDAKNEILEDLSEQKNLFMTSFFCPDNVVLDDFYKRKRYFILGYKGTGKTALLRYIETNLKQEKNIHSLFLLFKTAITEDDKKTMSRLAGTIIAEQNGVQEDVSYEEVWIWLIHRLIVHEIEFSHTNLFVNNKELEKYLKCVHVPDESKFLGGIGKFFPKIKRGNIKAAINAGAVSSELGLEFEWGDSNKEYLNFSSLVKQATALLQKLSPGGEELFIFLDELELVYATRKQYEKDIKLLRDLIVAICKLNEIFKKNGLKIGILAAIRNEVLSTISSAGREINKSIDDYGMSLRWQQAGGDVAKHPLIQMISQKIAASDNSISSEAVWEKYFPKRINSLPCQEYILRQTWYRPRDIVRLLGIVQKQFPNNERFEQYMFEAISKDYSMESWVELTEELLSKFNHNDLGAIKKVLTGFFSPFSKEDFQNRIIQLSSEYSDVDNFSKHHKAGDVLQVLYRVGVIGNTGERVRFFCRGDDDFDVTKSIKIHNPLWNYLSITPNRVYRTM